MAGLAVKIEGECYVHKPLPSSSLLTTDEASRSPTSTTPPAGKVSALNEAEKLSRYDDR